MGETLSGVGTLPDYLCRSNRNVGHRETSQKKVPLPCKFGFRLVIFFFVFRYNLKDDVRQSLYDECNYFAKAVKVKGTPFIGGTKPNLGDLAVYGVLSSIEGCDAFKDLLNNSNIKSWYYNMRNEVQNHQGGAYA